MIDEVGLQIEKFLKEVPSVKSETVFADRIVGKPYLEIDIDREAIARYGIHIRTVQDVIEVAVGGRQSMLASRPKPGGTSCLPGTAP